MYFEKYNGVHPPHYFELSPLEKVERDHPGLLRTVNRQGEELYELRLKIQELEKKILEYQTNSKINNRRKIKCKH